MKSILSATKPRKKCAICKYWNGDKPETPVYGYYLIEKENQGNCSCKKCVCSAMEECENFVLDEKYSEDNIVRCAVKTEQLYIPADIDTINTNFFENLLSLKEITVDEENKNYCSVDGVLFSKDKKTLIHYPLQKKDEDYTIPEGTETIIYFPAECPNLKHLHFPSSLKDIQDNPLNFALLNLDTFDIGKNEHLDNFIKNYGYSLKSQSITVDKSNSKYCALDGVLYSKDMKTLLAYPHGKTDTYFAIPDGVTALPKLIITPNLKEVYIPASVTEIYERTFFYCDNLEKITVDENNSEFYDDVFHKGFILD